jgi:hypothetical protein
LSSSSITSELFAVKSVEGEQLLDTTAISGTEKKETMKIQLDLVIPNGISDILV